MDRKTSLAEHTMVTFPTVGACGLPQVYCLFQLPSPRTPGTAAGNFAGMIGRTRVSRQLLRLSPEIPPNSRKQQGPVGWLHHLLPTPTLPHERPMPPETRCPGTDSQMYLQTAKMVDSGVFQKNSFLQLAFCFLKYIYIVFFLFVCFFVFFFFCCAPLQYCFCCFCQLVCLFCP